MNIPHSYLPTTLRYRLTPYDAPTLARCGYHLYPHFHTRLQPAYRTTTALPAPTYIPFFVAHTCVIRADAVLPFLFCTTRLFTFIFSVRVPFCCCLPFCCLLYSAAILTLPLAVPHTFGPPLYPHTVPSGLTPFPGLGSSPHCTDCTPLAPLLPPHAHSPPPHDTTLHPRQPSLSLSPILPCLFTSLLLISSPVSACPLSVCGHEHRATPAACHSYVWYLLFFCMILPCVTFNKIAYICCFGHLLAVVSCLDPLEDVLHSRHMNIPYGCNIFRLSRSTFVCHSPILHSFFLVLHIFGLYFLNKHFHSSSSCYLRYAAISCIPSVGIVHVPFCPWQHHSIRGGGGNLLPPPGSTAPQTTRIVAPLPTPPHRYQPPCPAQHRCHTRFSLHHRSGGDATPLCRRDAPPLPVLPTTARGAARQALPAYRQTRSASIVTPPLPPCDGGGGRGVARQRFPVLANLPLVWTPPSNATVTVAILA